MTPFTNAVLWASMSAYAGTSPSANSMVPSWAMMGPVKGEPVVEIRSKVPGASEVGSAVAE